MEVINLELKGLKLIKPQVFGDHRGYFVETYSSQTLEKFGITNQFVQDNQSKTSLAGTIRGIHFQKNPKPQTKLLRCTVGAILDVAIDLRKSSPTYKKWVAVELNEDNQHQLFIPSGFGHAFLTLKDNCIVEYKVDAFYSHEHDRSIAWNDPDINVEWGIDNPILSQKDKDAPKLCDSDVDF